MGATSAMVLNGGNAVNGFVGQQANARALNGQADFDTQLAKLQAKDAIDRGNFDASERSLRARQAIGAQRAGIAASGIDANSGSAVDLQADQAKFGELDAQMIRNNAAREAWGYTTQANLNAMGLRNEAAGERAQSYSTLLTGAAKTYGIYRNDHGTTSRTK